MTGTELSIVTNTTDLAHGIVLTTLDAVPAEWTTDAAIQAALRNDGSDSYNDREAFFIRSEPDRLLVVANTADGLLAGVAELLESVGYEILGMGPNWIHVPDKRDLLEFRIERAGRPSYYIRYLGPTSGQLYGVGTIHFTGKKLVEPPDEHVGTSYTRWRIGFRTLGQSMPGFPGHSMQSYHRFVVAKMKELNSTDGFLVEKAWLAPDAERASASADNAGHLWINTDNDKVFLSDGKEWKECNLAELGVNLDLSVPFVREIILEKMKEQSERFFEKNPEEPFIFGTDPEDGGGYAALEKLLRHKNWYPDYLAQEGVEFGKPYVLHGYNGLDQPRELWDANAPSDTVFGFNNWLLREYDQWIDSLPAEQRVTSAGQSKKELVRCSLYSYNYHDVPPNFNLDPRIRVMIASYPKHRGRGKWKQFRTQQDMAKAFQVMLPREPSGDYRIISLSYYWDFGIDMVAPQWDASPAALSRDLGETYRAGIKAMSYEIDFNFGRFGLGYYLISKLLWNANLTAAELDAIRDRWLQRAYGSGWKTMKAYYDFMLKENFPVNGPRAWAQAIRLIDAADKQIDDAREPAAQRRLDDLKQFWYYAYLLDHDKMKANDPDTREFAWKGQMSYMNAMHVVVRRVFGQGGVNGVVEAVGPDIAGGPAHYTHAETQAWWAKVLEYWPLEPVTRFTDATLADGRKGKDVDLNDLVRVKEFGNDTPIQGLIYNSGYQKPPKFVCVARRTGEEIGFKLFWPADPTLRDGYYIAKELPYGVDVWDATKRAWEPWLDKSMNKQPSVEVPKRNSTNTLHLVEVRLKAPRAGTYRFDIGYGGNASTLADLGYDMTIARHTDPHALTFTSTAEGITQSGTWIYIPKGTKSLDLEVWDNYKAKTVTFFKKLPVNPAEPSRKVDISARATHRIPLEPGEDGTLALIQGNGFAFPYLYSVPMYWAKNPAQLAVPRAIAEADGLTIMN